MRLLDHREILQDHGISVAVQANVEWNGIVRVTYQVMQFHILPLDGAALYTRTGFWLRKQKDFY